MFHFPSFPPLTLCVQVRVTGHDSSWVSPFGHPRITAWLPTPRGLSQAPTSFIGSWCQGIHHVPFIACLNNVKTTQLQRPLPPTPIKGRQHKKSHRHPHHTPQHSTPTHPLNKGTNQHTPPGHACGHQMLASTIQISNNNPTNPHQPRTGTSRQREDKKNQPPPPRTRTQRHTPRPAALIPQDPTVCHDPTTGLPHPRFHTTTPHPKAEDSSSTEEQNNPAPDHSSTIPLVNTTMRPHTNGEGRGVCSLERR